MKTKPCEGFQWIGQPLWTCERCEWPYWEHSHDERPDRSHPFGPLVRVPITPDQAAAVERKWARSEPRECRERRIATKVTPPESA